jgi:hypothetical protein
MLKHAWSVCALIQYETSTQLVMSMGVDILDARHSLSHVATCQQGRH